METPDPVAATGLVWERRAEQCRAVTSTGDRCKRKAVPDSEPELCATHRTLRYSQYVPIVPGWAVRERSESV